MGHGVPLTPDGADNCETRARFHFDVGLSSSFAVAKFWGIAADRPQRCPLKWRAPRHQELSGLPRKDPRGQWNTCDRSQHSGDGSHGGLGAFCSFDDEDAPMLLTIRMIRETS